MAKKQKFSRINNPRAAMLLLVVTVVVVAAAVAMTRTYERLNNSSKAADAVAIRSMILEAAEGTKKEAPVDAKTGDIYFPEAKLFLPASPANPQLTYYYDASAPELSVSDRTIFSQNAAKLYGAPDVEQVFAAVPKLQSCQRGISLTHKPANSNDKFQEKIALNNGKTLYASWEKTCPELKQAATQLKNLRTY